MKAHHLLNPECVLGPWIIITPYFSAPLITADGAVYAVAVDEFVY
jgi:hypothetical protein